MLIEVGLSYTALGRVNLARFGWHKQNLSRPMCFRKSLRWGLPPTQQLELKGKSDPVRSRKTVSSWAGCGIVCLLEVMKGTEVGTPVVTTMAGLTPLFHVPAS